MAAQLTFVVSQVNGTWRTAEEVPGTAALNEGGSSESPSVSCTCSAGGLYADSSDHFQTFVVNRT